MSSCMCGRCSGRHTCDTWKKRYDSKDDHDCDSCSSTVTNGLVTGPLRLFTGTLVYPAVQSLSDCKQDVLIKFIRKDVPTVPTEINPCICCPVTIDCRCVTIPCKCCGEDLVSPQTTADAFFTVPEDGVYEVVFCPLSQSAKIRATVTLVTGQGQGNQNVQVIPHAEMLVDKCGECCTC